MRSGNRARSLHSWQSAHAMPFVGGIRRPSRVHTRFSTDTDTGTAKLSPPSLSHSVCLTRSPELIMEIKFFSVFTRTAFDKNAANCIAACVRADDRLWEGSGTTKTRENKFSKLMLFARHFKTHTHTWERHATLSHISSSEHPSHHSCVAQRERKIYQNKLEWTRNVRICVR